MKIVTSFKTTCAQIVTNFKTAIGSIVVSSQLGAQFSLHVILIFVTIFIARCLISVNSGFQNIHLHASHVGEYSATIHLDFRE